MTTAKDGPAERRRGKPQKTGLFVDKDGNHLWEAFAGGWPSEYWARIMAEAIVLSALAMDPPYWILFGIRPRMETAFTKSLGRLFESKRIPSRYIVIRAKSLASTHDVHSWYFICGLEIEEIAAESVLYSDAKPEIISDDELEQLMKALFKLDMHPDAPDIRRWSASRAMRHDLALHRMRYLIRLVRERKEHELTPGSPGMTTFEKGLARYIRRDRPLIFILKLVRILSLLLEIMEMNDQEITIDEILAVMKELLKIHGRWQMYGSYPGLPSAGAKLDRADGRYDVLQGKLSVLSTRRDSPTEADLEWDMVEFPKPEEGYL